MLRRSLVFLPPTILGLIVLFTSILRAGSIKYNFEPTPAPTTSLVTTSHNYLLPATPLILPDNPLWGVSVGFERVLLTLTLDQVTHSERLIAMADKRLISAVELVESGNPELGISVLTKAEKYLQQAADVEKAARLSGVDTTQVISTLTNASYAHKKVLDDITLISPETARPIIVATSNIPQLILSELDTDLAAIVKSTNF